MESLNFSSLFSVPTLTSLSLRTLIEGGQSWDGKKRKDSKYRKDVESVFRILIVSICGLFKRVGAAREFGSQLRNRSGSCFGGSYYVGDNCWENLISLCHGRGVDLFEVFFRKYFSGEMVTYAAKLARFLSWSQQNDNAAILKKLYFSLTVPHSCNYRPIIIIAKLDLNIVLQALEYNEMANPL